MQEAPKKAVIVTSVGLDIIAMLDEEAKRIDSPRSFIIRKILREYLDQKKAERAEVNGG